MRAKSTKCGEKLNKVIRPLDFIIINRVTKFDLDREAIDISAHTKNTHVIAELLIEVLSSWVSQPLLTYALYDSFLLTADFTLLNDRLTAQHTLCDSLPSYFKATVKQCLALLLKVTENAPLTRVTLDKLAPIFAPILLRPKKLEPYMADHDEQKVKRLFLEMVGATIATVHHWLMSH